MTIRAPHRSFAGALDEDVFEEHSSVEGRKTVRKVRPAWVVRGRSRLASTRGGLGRILHGLARALYLGPVLVLFKLLARAAGFASDYVTVAFVILVVVFFAVLDLYLFVSVIWWFGRKSAERLRLVLPRRAGEKVGSGASDPAAASTGDRVLATGRVVALAGDGGEVLRDLWLADGDRPLRLVEVTDFAVVAEGRPTVVVSCATSPALFADGGDRTTVRAWLEESSEPTRELAGPLVASERASGHAFSIRPGDEVRVVGALIRSMPDPLPEPSVDSPYRRAGSGAALVVGEHGQAPVRIAKS